MIAAHTVPIGKLYTQASDSGYFLQSNGTAWSLATFQKPFRGSLASLTQPIAPVAVTWSLLGNFTATSTKALWPGDFGNVTLPGIQSSDVCVNTDPNASYQVMYIPGSGGIYVISSSQQGTPAGWTFLFRCYRPSL